jgi:hypothetical protein
MAKQQTAARKASRSKGGPQQEADSDASGNGSEDRYARYEQELADYLQERIKPGLNRGAVPLLARSIAKDLARKRRPDGASENTAEDDEPRAEADEEFEDEARDEAFEDADDEPRDEAGDEYDDDPEAEEDDEAEAEADDEYDDEAEAEADDEYDDEAEAEADDEYDDEVEAEADDEDDEESAAAEGEVSAFEEEMHQLQADLGGDWIVRFSVQGDNAWLTAEKEDGSQHVEAPTADVLREAVELLEGT